MDVIKVLHICMKKELGNQIKLGKKREKRQERAIKRMNLTQVHYMYVWAYNEVTLVMLIKVKKLTWF